MGKTIENAVNRADSLRAMYLLSYGDGMNCLPRLFNLYEAGKLNIRNRCLHEDIRECIRLVTKLEKDDARKFQRRQYKSFDQKDIDRLSEIISQFDYSLRVDFTSNLSIADREEYQAKLTKDNPQTLDSKLKSLSRRHRCVEGQLNDSLDKLAPRFYVWEDPGNLKSDDEHARHLLKVGLFDYFQRLVHGDRFRPRKCVGCLQWFAANKKNKRACGLLCKDKNWRKNCGGDEKRRKNQKVYRRNRKASSNRK